MFLTGLANIAAANTNENSGNNSTNCFDKCRLLYVFYDNHLLNS